MPLLILLGSTIVLTLMPGWRSYLAGVAVTAGLLAWSYWPLAGAGNYGTVVYDYIVALGAPFFWLAFVLAMVGKIAWLGKTAPLFSTEGWTAAHGGKL
jgi:hypothetical protein